ncbi:MAG: class I SAM-dependent methyltransferase [Candidatus Obscuribacterales bacterium]|nr:class I SAM-dependent methyltransferase [Candidatus Obscuribacterales bacterium]
MTIASETELYTACPICGSKELSDLYTVHDFTISECRKCTLVFVREKMTSETLGPFYEKHGYDYVYDDEKNQENLKFYYRRLKQVLNKRQKPGKVLDIGCNRGQFLDVMGEEWERYGTEFTKRWADEARAKYGEKNIHQGPLSTYDLEGKLFDVVTMLDVLDHCPQPVDDLKQVNRVLKKGGLVVVKVHNISCLYAQITKDQFYAISPPGHLFYFNKATLKESLKQAGFKVVSNMFIGHVLDLKTVPYRLARGAQSGFYFNAYQMLNKSPLGNMKIYKDLHDIITVLAVKETEA